MILIAYCENSVQYIPPDGLFGIKFIQNSISAMALPQSCWVELMMFPQIS